jgi:lipopolysaccharide export system permease protein
MQILKRYVLSNFIQNYLIILFAMIGIYMVIDIFERMDEFVSHNAAWADFFLYYLYKVPFISYFMGPQAVLLATVITLASMAQNNELTAMKASGVSLGQITFPILAASALLSVLLIFSNEYVTPVTSAKMNYIYNVKVHLKKQADKIQKSNIWLRSADGSIWNISDYDPNQSTMRNVSLFSYDEKKLLITRRIDALEVIWNGKNWEFLDGYVRMFGVNGVSNTRYFEKENFPVLETPGDFNKGEKKPEEMGLIEMFQTIQAQELEGVDTAALWVDLHQKISYPFICVVLALIGIPLSLRTSRSGGVLFSATVSLGFGFVFSFFYAMGISLGHGGTFHPVLASWGPNLLFISVGFYLILTIDSEKLLPI